MATPHTWVITIVKNGVIKLGICKNDRNPWIDDLSVMTVKYKEIAMDIMIVIEINSRRL
jgi:hypothetical protein